MKRAIAITFSALALAIGGAAQASVVYANGAPNQASGNEMTQWIQAEDFTLASTTTITDVHFWAVQDTFGGTIDYAFYSDNNGSPNQGVPLAGFAAGTSLATTCGQVLFFGTECEYSFDVTPFTALAGVTYWLGLHNGSLGNDQRAEFYWETTGNNATKRGHEDELPGPGDGWSNNGQEHAFSLTGDVVPSVPEPASLALLGLGLAGLGFNRRRRT